MTRPVLIFFVMLVVIGLLQLGMCDRLTVWRRYSPPLRELPQGQPWVSEYDRGYYEVTVDWWTETLVWSEKYGAWERVKSQ